MAQIISPLQLKKIADSLRVDILQMIFQASSGHPGGSLSAIDILTGLFFGGVLKHQPKNPQWRERDFFILSKGHAAPALYAVLAERGYFAKKELANLRQVSALLQGHPCTHIPGVEIATGSLGQGLSAGVGLALGLKQDGRKNRVYVFLGDGETNEGQVYEAAMAGAHYGLDNLCAVLDWNGLQIDGANDEVMSLGDVAGKWRAFGWRVLEIDGHDFKEISGALGQAQKNSGKKPCLILARTVKGKGAPCAEGKFEYHGKSLSAEEMKEAVGVLKG